MSSNNDKRLKRYTPSVQRYDVNKIKNSLVAADPKREGEEEGLPKFDMSEHSIKAILNSQAEDIIDSKSVMEILPDTKLSMDILTASIMSPNDLFGSEINFELSDEADDNEAYAPLLSSVREFFKNDINIEKMCVPALEHMLFHSGSYPIIAVPSSSVDNIIAGGAVSLENLSDFTDNFEPKPLGFIGEPKETDGNDEISLESIIAASKPTAGKMVSINDNLSFTDNPVILKKTMVEDSIAMTRTSDIVKGMGMECNVSIESAGGREEKKVVLYPERDYKTTPFMELLGVNGIDVGEPILFKPNPESVIPIHVPGNVEEQIGAIIVLDKNGNSASTASSKKHWDKLKNFTANETEKEYDVEAIRREMFGGGDKAPNENATRAEIHKAYISHVERQVYRSMAAGAIGDNVEFEMSNETKLMMTSRAMGRMKTKLLYVPKELLVYMAFDYDEFGCGKSLLSKTKILGSIRAMLLFASTNSAMKNSTPHRLLNIELSPQDKDPDGTVEKVLTLNDANARGGYPIGTMDMTNIANSVNRSGISVNVSNHPAYPNTKVTMEDQSRNVAGIDTELDDKYRNRHLQSWGLTPEMVDASVETDFAANLLLTNKLFAKRISNYQSEFTPFLTRIARIFGSLSPKLMGMFNEGLKESKVKNYDFEELVTKFFGYLEVTLPTPDSAKLEAKLDELELFKNSVDAALEMYFSEDLLEGWLDSDLADGILATQNAIRASIVRAYMRNNNILPEIEQVFSTGEVGDLLKGHTEHVSAILKATSDQMRKLGKLGRKHEVKVDKDIEKEEQDLDDELDQNQGIDDDLGNQDDLDNTEVTDGPPEEEPQIEPDDTNPGGDETNVDDNPNPEEGDGLPEL